MGGRAAVEAKYKDALGKHHTVVPAIVEVFGSFDEGLVKLLDGWAKRAKQKTPPGEEPPWAARNFIPFWSQLLSKAAQQGAAREILGRVTEEADARDAARTRRA